MDRVIRCKSIGEIKDQIINNTLISEPRILVLSDYISRDEARGIELAFSSSARHGGSSIYSSSAIPLYEYREDSGASIENYLAEAESLWLGHRKLMAVFGDPVQRLMTELGLEIGAEIPRLELLHRPCFFGQFRCFTEKEDIDPHVDLIEREFPSLLQPPLRQWALNISIRTSDVGGELQIWDYVPSVDEYRGYSLPRPPMRPTVTFKPSVGDLYFFEPRFVHAIAASRGPRCALAGFLAVWPGNRVRVWS